jgi:glycosyltransferase XagB
MRRPRTRELGRSDVLPKHHGSLPQQVGATRRRPLSFTRALAWFAMRLALLISVAAGSLVLASISFTSLLWMLHAWRTRGAERDEESPPPVTDPQLSFSIIVPARHEERVLEATLSSLLDLDHPRVEILVVVGDDDIGTQAIALDASRSAPDRIRVVNDRSLRKSKPGALNAALRECRGEVVGIFDAEDEVHPSLLRYVEAWFRFTDAEVVQGMVQLMDHRSSWYAPLPVLEYFFWFNSRLRFQRRWRFVPLGGNTVFIKRELLEAVGGWDRDCLTEDCDLGARLATISARVAVIGIPELATREETPPSVRTLFRQRTRWDQGFLQVLRKGDWRFLPFRAERLLAVYTLAMPFLHGLVGLSLPLALFAILWLKTPIALALWTFVPALLLLITLAVNMAGLREFCLIYAVPSGLSDHVRVVLAMLPYQVVLAAAAIWAGVRQVVGARNWAKTPHFGNHRLIVPSTPMVQAAGSTLALAGGQWTAPGRITLTDFRALDVDRRRNEGTGSGRWVEPELPERNARIDDPHRWWARRLEDPRRSTVFARQASDWLRIHRRSLLVLIGILMIVTLAHAHGMTRSPAFDDDEGTYVSQAWAVLNLRRLSYYTYWYDHPPLGWILIALWAGLTRAFARYPDPVAVGRELALVANLVSCALLYLVARRLRLRRAMSVACVCLFAFSPVGFLFHRMVFLDNLATPFVLAALGLSLSPRRRLAAHAGAAVCFGVAILVKETSLLLLPALALQLWRTTDLRTRRFSLALACSVFLAVTGLYVLFAILRGELVPGSGHVSLLGSTAWQLFSRPTSGSVFNPASPARSVVSWWLQMDPYLLAAAALLVPVGLAMRRLQPVTVAFALQAAMILRPGYLPRPLVIGILPFAALLASGVADATWARASRRGSGHGEEGGSARVRFLRVAAGATLAVMLLSAVLVAPTWFQKDRELTSVDHTGSYRAAREWLITYAPTDARMLVDNVYWIDLVDRGYSPISLVWFYKLDLDPAVAGRFPEGWRDFDYFVAPDWFQRILPDFPGLDQLRLAFEHSTVVATFGSGSDRVVIRRIRDS